MKAVALLLKPSDKFVETPFVNEVAERALSYLKAGFPVNLSGPTGCGKTTLAFHIAKKLGKPITFIVGNEEVKSSSLIGGESGYSRRLVVDRFISSVLKVEEATSKLWLDERLLTAFRSGFTFIYDEFTRVRPEVNNILLPVLEERILSIPSALGETYVKVHPDFKAILTSNPEEYAGAYRVQDALMDRVITISLDNFDEDTEIRITMARSYLAYEEAERIVRIVRRLRETGLCEYPPTIRASIMLARIKNDVGVDFNSHVFREICRDILTPKIGKGRSGDLKPEVLLDEVLNDEIGGNA